MASGTGCACLTSASRWSAWSSYPVVEGVELAQRLRAAEETGRRLRDEPERLREYHELRRPTAARDLETARGRGRY